MIAVVLQKQASYCVFMCGMENTRRKDGAGCGFPFSAQNVEN
jgi:hypothetical protein